MKIHNELVFTTRDGAIIRERVVRLDDETAVCQDNKWLESNQTISDFLEKEQIKPIYYLNKF